MIRTNAPKGLQLLKPLIPEIMPSWNTQGGFTESLLIITGSMGAGKTSILSEASDILSLHQIAHAAIDVDALGIAHLPFAATSDDVMYANLQSVCQNYASFGVQRFLLARSIEDRAQLERCRGIIPAANTLVCRIAASIETMQQRIRMRELGIERQAYVARVATLNAILDRACLEDFTVTNENRPLNDVAMEMLIKAGWISN